MFTKSESDNKPIFFVSPSEKRVSNHSVEWIHSTGSNQWQGWYCSAGKQSLYIDFDGNVFIGTCAVGGWYGNVFRQGLSPDKKLNQWIQCTAKVCQCGADMFAAKVKNKNLIPAHIEDLYQTIESGSSLSKSEQEVKPEIILSTITKSRKIVIWDLGRRCNYSCSYCFPDSHNDYEAHKTLKSLKHAFDGLTDWWLEGYLGKFTITGGEPTLNPDYLDFVKYIKFKNPYHLVHTTTNGSRDHKYYRELMTYSDITFSAHTESLTNARTYDRFNENVRACIETKTSNKVANGYFLQVRIMLKPGTMDLVARLLDDIRSIPGFSDHAVVNCDLLHQSGNKVEMVPYTDVEISFAQANA